MKKLFMLMLVAAATAGVQAQNIISWNENNGNTIPATGVAGVVAATNWNNSINGMSLVDNSGAASGVSFTIGGTYGAWGIASFGTPDGNGTYNRTLLGGYANTSSGIGPEIFTISGISYSSYDLIVYLDSDSASRVGTISSANAGITYDFSTMGSSQFTSTGAAGNAIFTQTTDTTGANPSADYVIFTNLTGSSDTLTLNIANGGGIAGFQIVKKGVTVATLSLGTDTTITPASVYTGGSATLSAAFVGTPTITNQWKVDKGSGFVNVPGATNSTLILTNLQTTNSGNYALYASNAAGASNSTPVTLTVLAATVNVSLNVQFSGTAFGSPAGPVQTGSAVIGNDSDVWNLISNPTYSTTTAGTALGTNLALFDVNSIGTAVTMDYVGDYIYTTTANPFSALASPYANLMSGIMGSVTTTAADTNTVTLHNLTPGIYDIYLYASARSDAQQRIAVFTVNGQTAVCGPNNGNYTLTSGANYLHLTPTVSSSGVLNISYYGTVDAGQGMLNGFQLNGPSATPSIFLTSDTTCDSPANDYVGRTVNLAAAFGGNPPPALQWKVDYGSGFVVIPSATNSTLTLANLQTTNSGSYSLFANNTAGSLSSTPLALNVQPVPNPLAVDVQFTGSSYGGGVAATQVGNAIIGGGSDFWNPVSNPLPTGNDTNAIFGSGQLLSDVNNYGTAITLDYTGNQIFNNGVNTPFDASGSPAEYLMEASLVVLNSNTATVTLHSISAGTYDLYLYSCAASAAQGTVTRFSANGSFGTAGPNATNNVLMLGTNYVHLTPTVTASGLLQISFVGNVTGQGNLNGIQLSGPGATPLSPNAAFTGTPNNAYVTQPVVFTDASSGNITNWVWNLGDGTTITNSSNANISHAYVTVGAYTVSLIVRGAGGSSTNMQTGYVVVSSVPSINHPVLAGANLILTGTGGIANAQYRILSTTNVALSLASWIPVWTNVFAPDGSYSYTNSPLTNAATFFRLATP